MLKTKLGLSGLFIVALALLFVWVDGAHSDFVPCAANCGETFDALKYVDNFRLYGTKYAFVQDMATSPDLAARPFLYTHNVNLGGLVFTALEAVGVTSLGGKQFFTLIAFGLGLIYAYRTTLLFIGSGIAAFITLTLFATDYTHVLSYGLNALRAWHFLAIFGLLFHLGRLTLEEKAKSKWDWAAVAVMAFIAFGIGYDFWITCFFIASYLVFFTTWWRAGLRQTLKVVGSVGLFFLLPLGLRQWQIANALGAQYWFTDLRYSALIKVSFLNKLLGTPDLLEVEAFYRAWNVLRPPATAAQSFNEILGTLGDMVRHISIPSFGFVSFALMIGGGLGALFWLGSKAQWYQKAPADAGAIDKKRTAILIGTLFLGVITGLAVFMPVSLHIYLKHEFPLVIVPVHVTKGAAIAAVLSMAHRATVKGTKYGLGLTALAAFLVVDIAIVAVQNVRANKPIDTSWIEAVKARKDSTFAVSWVPNSVSIFTTQWVVGVQPSGEYTFLTRISGGEPPFKNSDLFLFGERDAVANHNRYLNPQFWLYYPTDQSSYFDHPTPQCRADYLLEFVASHFRRVNVGVTSINNWTIPPKTRPGGTVAFGGQLDVPWQLVDHVEFAASIPAVVPVALDQVKKLFETQGQNSITRAAYNCIYKSFVGTTTISADAVDGTYFYPFRVVLKDGRNVVIGGATVTVDSHAPVVDIDPTIARKSQPSVNEILNAYPALSIVDRGRDYLIIDLEKH